MHVSEKLPCVVIRAAITKERIVIQINLLLVDLIYICIVICSKYFV